MRNVFAACCCAIVGLEVLIAVPLITCLAVLGVVGGVDVQHVSSDPPLPPQYAGPPPYFPLPPLSPAGFDGPTTVPPAINQWAAPPATCPTTEAPPPPLSPQVEAIAEARQRVGSPLAESSLAGNSATIGAESSALLEQIVAQNAASPPDSAPSQQPSSQPSPLPIASFKPASEPKDCPAASPGPASLVDSLRTAADQLYIRAQALEIDGNFGRADQIRTLAREIRTEIDLLRRESGHTPAPATVSAAAFNSSLLDEPAPLHRFAGPVEAAIPISSRASLVPARAEFVEKPVNPPLMMMVSPSLIIQEVEEEKLGIETTPQNPAP